MLAHNPLFVLTACFILAFHGETMKYTTWSFFLAAAWLATWYLRTRGVSVMPVFADCGLAGVIAWRTLSRNRARSVQQSAAA
jgi:hypothetical protein